MQDDDWKFDVRDLIHDRMSMSSKSLSTKSSEDPFRQFVRCWHGSFFFCFPRFSTMWGGNLWRVRAGMSAHPPREFSSALTHQSSLTLKKESFSKVAMCSTIPLKKLQYWVIVFHAIRKSPDERVSRILKDFAEARTTGKFDSKETNTISRVLREARR